LQNGVAAVSPTRRFPFPAVTFSNLSLVDLEGHTVVASNGTAMVMNPSGATPATVPRQHLTVKPFRAYHISVQIKDAEFSRRRKSPCSPEIKRSPTTISASSRLSDWKTHQRQFSIPSTTRT